MSLCLPKPLADLMKTRLKSGEIDPAKLIDMSSDERHKFFADFLGEENAKLVNSQFEGKLLLKNQQQGIISWAKKITGISPEAQRDIISRVNKMETLLNPESEKAFLGELASKRLGVDVSLEEAQKISQLSRDVTIAKAQMETSGDRMAYGRARVAFGEYINGLKEQAQSKTLLESLKSPVKTATEIAGTAKSMKATMDNSAIFRQGWKTMFTNPNIWAKNAFQSFKDIADSFGGKQVLNEVNADIVSRPNFNLMQKAKLAVGTIEEAYPSSKLPSKIPLFGRVYNASESAFTAFVHRTRADVFDKYVEIAQKSGLDLTDKAQIESIGKLVNSLTGRGNLGKLELGADAVNNIFFSPRLLKSNIDVLTAHSFQRGVTPFVRYQAGLNLLKIVSGTAAILTLADFLQPGSVEKDPTSSDFGKIKVGNTRFDVSGGMSGIVTLAMRLAEQKTKSSVTGVVTPLNSGEFGAMTRKDVVYNFFENKLSPAASVVKDILQDKTFSGEKPTVANELKNLFVPLPITNYIELKKDPNSANIIASMIADGLGIGTNTYGPNVNWNVTPSAEMKQFKAKVGETKFKEANTKFNQEFSNWLQKTKGDPRLNALSEEDKAKVMTAKRSDIKEAIFRSYGFTPKTTPSKKLPKF